MFYVMEPNVFSLGYRWPYFRLTKEPEVLILQYSVTLIVCMFIIYGFELLVLSMS